MGRESGIRFVIRGRVQGVFFRASAAREARRLGLRGHAINCADGSVEVLAVGSPQALEELRGWLWRGPPAALVTDVSSSEIAADGLSVESDFRTG